MAVMRRVASILAGLLLQPYLAAQDKPYQEGGVDALLATAKAAGRPAIVLFNFDEESG